ncbi:MAG: M1 family aminopeptidase [Lewinella sp.]
MFSSILNFEFKYRRVRPATYAYFFLLLVFGFILAANGANAISEKAYVNSATVVTNLVVVVSIFMTLLASAVMGVPVYRDIEHGVKNYYFSYPVSERGYLMGRYVGSLLTLIFISFGLLLGLFIGYALGPALGWEEAERFGPHRLGDYVYAYVVFMLPNLLLTGTLFFCLVALTRQIFVSYVGSILFFVFYLVATTLASDLDNQTLVSILDPFGTFAFREQTKYLTPVEQNTFHVPIIGTLLINRLLWFGVAAALLGYTLVSFRFTRFLGGARAKVKAHNAVDRATEVDPFAGAELKPVQQRFSTSGYLRQMLSQVWIEFKSILRDPYFIGILAGAVLFLFFDGWFSNSTYGTKSYPTTYYMLEMKNATYIIFVMVILVFYTGEVVHRDRTVGFDQIADALPVPNWAVYGGKLLTMVLVTFVLVTLVWVIGVFSQTIQGYFNYDFGQYFTDLYLLTWPQYIVLVSLAFFVHVLVNKKFVGHVLAIGLYAALFFIPGILEINYNLVLFGSRPGYMVSDMNDFGHFIPAVSWFNVYWLAFGVMLMLLGLLFFARGTDNAWRSRFQRVGQAWGWRPAVVLATAFGVFALSGFTIYNNVSVLNAYSNREDGLDRTADYERQYRRYLGMNQPMITAADVAVDLRPNERALDARGTFGIINRGDQAIDSILFNIPFDEKQGQLVEFTIDGWQTELLTEDQEHDMAFYRLTPALQPGDSVTMTLATELAYRGFPNEGLQRNIVHNGTFLNQGDIFPSFGYNPAAEIGSETERKKRDLPLRDYTLPPVTDEQGRNTFSFTPYADGQISFRAVVSTDPDQIAIAPGRLQREWTEDGRRYFEYAEPAMDYFFNISSARYTVDEEVWNGPNGEDVDIQVFRHEDHGLNVDRYIDAVKSSLDYFSENFGPYQFDQLRILEFPRYAGFAQSFANTVPYSESFGWLGKFDDPDDTDYAFTVTSHEVAHQWWGHQIQPSATRGGNQLSETMAEYASLMVTKERYGEAAMQPTLKYELDSYLRGRAGESKFEKTLVDNDDQAYVWYRKGALVMYALQDYVGEDRLNDGFRAFIDSFAMRRTGPYPTSEDWYNSMASVTPDSLQYFLEESFRGITLYENRALTATSAPSPDSDAESYAVTLKVDTRKIKYDGNGNELERPNERSLIEIGVFGPDGENELGMTSKTPLYLQKHWLTPGEHEITVTVKERPVKAGIDPYNKLIDRVSDDNLVDVE